MRGNFERTVRRAILRQFRDGQSRRDFPHYGPATPPRSILLIRTDRLGDAIISTPLIRRLRTQFPAASIDIVLGAKNRAIAPLLTDINHAYTLSTNPIEVLSCISTIRSRRYDVVIDLLLKPSATATLATRLSGARIALGFESVLTPGQIERLHVVQATSMLASGIGVGGLSNVPLHPRDLLTLAISDTSREWGRTNVEPYRAAVLVNVSAQQDRRPSNAWFIHLCSQLRIAGRHPLLVCAPNDEANARTIARESGTRVVTPTHDYSDFAGVIAAAGIVITPDSSVVHLAAAAGRPTVLLAVSRLSAQLWGPWGVPSRTLVADFDISSISTYDVAKATLELAADISGL